jgi:hypothetical protein
MVIIGVLFFLVFQGGCVRPISSGGDQVVWDFEKDVPGSLPSGWSQASLGNGVTTWAVQGADSDRVLAQLASGNPNRHFNMTVCDTIEVRNVTLTVRLRAVSGEHDQGGGFVWRYQDERNHYIVRANPLENNVVLYKMVDGVRTDLPLVGAGRTYGVKVDPMGQTWHTLKLKAMDSEFTVSLDGQVLFQVQDTTFTGAGRVGLWTKADAVTWFDDFAVQMK